MEMNNINQYAAFLEKRKTLADILDRSSAVIHDLNRGVTALDAQGWYSGESKKVLLIMVRKPELHTITKVVKEIDPKAFVTVASASTVYGEGFDEMKTGINLKLKKKAENAREERPEDN